MNYGNYCFYFKRSFPKTLVNNKFSVRFSDDLFFLSPPTALYFDRGVVVATVAL